MPDTTLSDSPAQSGFQVTLRTQLHLLSPVLAQNAKQTFNEHLTQAQYIEYMQDLYHSVKASCPVMAVAVDAFKKLNDPRLQPLQDYLEHHIKEEMFHDEWILEDLEHMGVDRELTLQKKPLDAIINLIGSVYYRVLHIHPVAIFGFISALETFPISQQTLDTIMKAADLDDKAVRTLKHHGVADVDHANEIFEALASVVLNKREQDTILDCAKGTIYHLANFV